ncbi:MAG: hypothetical protein LUI05_02175 [Oscillospiraceae bacterium]|nr:hypothetical protein [Oscillospiraceae bacterium]
MLSGTDKFTLASGTVCTVHWTRPEVGVDITLEEQQRRMRKFAQTWLGIVKKDCARLLDIGEPELAEKRWRDAGLDMPPPWKRKKEE